MDNPTYDEAIRINSPDKATKCNDNIPECGTIDSFQYPSYSVIGMNLETRNMYEGLIQNTMAGEALYESIRNRYVSDALDNEEEDAKMNGGIMEGISGSGAVYDVLKTDNDYDDICYSVQGPPEETTYSEV